MTVDPHAQLGAIRLGRDFLEVTGPDAASFLQGQLSQDVAGLEVGASAPTLLLQPQGKVEAWLRVTRLGEERLVLDVEAGWGEAVATRLNRFKIRVRCEIAALDWRCVALRGPGAAAVEPSSAKAEVVAPVDWPGVEGVDLLGAEVVVPDGIGELGPEAFEALRIEAGVPAMGTELDESTIPAEAGIVDRSVSFTKGCYVGQELVARVDSRGSNTPRKLRFLAVSGNEAPPVGAEVVDEGEVVGHITSSVVAPWSGTSLALAYTSRKVVPPLTVRLRWTGGEAAAELSALPGQGPSEVPASG